MINYQENELFNYEESKKAFYNELYDADYDYSQNAIEKNYELWAQNKENVYNFLRQHKDWREDLMAIDTKIDVVRALGDVRGFLQKVKTKLKTCHQWCINNPSGKDALSWVLDVILSSNWVDANCEEFSHKIVQRTIDLVDNYFNNMKNGLAWQYNKIMEYLNNENNKNKKDYEIIEDLYNDMGDDYSIYVWYFGDYRPLHKGQPISRTLIKIIENLNLKDGIFNMYDYRNDSAFMNGSKFYKADGTWLIDYYFNQNQITTILSDLCKEKVIQKRFIISINPMDYLTQSHGEIDGSSCHSLKSHGCYHGGIISMMTDPSSVIVYEIDDDLTFDCQHQRIFFNSKIQRQLMFIADNIQDGFFQSVYYPSKDNSSTLAITNKMKELYKQVYDIDLNTKQDSRIIHESMVDNTYYLSYEDWFNGKVMTLSSPSDITPHFTIGGKWWTASNKISPERRGCEDTDTLDPSNHEGEVWCTDIEEWRDRECCFYVEDLDEWYYYDDNLYYTEDTEKYYSDNYNLYYCENDGLWYEDRDNVYYAEDEDCYYSDDSELFHTQDTDRYYANNDDLFQNEDGEWFEFEYNVR